MILVDRGEPRPEPESPNIKKWSEGARSSMHGTYWGSAPRGG